MKEISISLLMFLIGATAGYLLKQDRTETQYYEKIVYDTILKTIEYEPIRIISKPKIITKKDTIIVTKPFTARLDTVVIRDTITLAYDYPENIFSLDITRKQDTLYIPAGTIIKYRNQPWYETAAYALGGVTLGYLLGGMK